MTLDQDRENFNRWYKEPIETLLTKDYHTGFAVLMIALPMLERYLREKTGICEDPKLCLHFYDEMLAHFPSLKSRANAQRFWAIYRHGLLHQATLKAIGEGTIAGVHNQASLIECDADGRSFRVSPERFARAVIEIIENDFPTFQGAGSPRHQMATVISGVSGFSGINNK